MAKVSVLHPHTVILCNVLIWKGKLYKSSERFRNLRTSENMSSRCPQNVSSKRHRKRVLNRIIEEAERCGSEKDIIKISSKL